MVVDNNQLTKFITKLSITLSIMIGFSLPVIASLLAYHDLDETLRFKAKLKANELTSLISTLPHTWMFAENRSHGLLKREPVILDTEQVKLYDAQKRLVTLAGQSPKGFLIHRSCPLYDIDTVVGEVVISASLSPLIFYTMKVSVLGLGLGGLILLIMQSIPVRHLKRIAEELYQEKEHAIITLDSIGDVVLRTDINGCIVFINTAGEKMLGLALYEIQGRVISDILHITDNTTGIPYASVLVNALASQKEVACEGRSTLHISKQHSIAVDERAAPIFDRTGKIVGGVLCLRDVSIARKNLERRSWEASHDTLTKILNRRAFEEHIDTALKQLPRHQNHHSLCFIDLDRFKIVNDSCGHAAGDELLIQLTQSIQSKIREEDVFARLGGDEFGLLLSGCDASTGKIIAENLIEEINQFQFIWDKQIFNIGLSIGLTVINDSSKSVRDVLGEADLACYRVKENGRNQVHLFLPSDVELALRRDQISWVGRITAALRDNRFVLYHQTYRTLSNNNQDRDLHLEVLIRMLDEDDNIVLPGFFLPTAERYDLVQDIDRWVINQVFSQFHTLSSIYAGHALMVNINLSGASINSNELFSFIKEKLLAFNIDPQTICFEITETAAVKDINASIRFINACNKIGIKLALDDFGTGTSSFEYLKNLPVDYLKIDGGFVRNIETNAVDREMVASINRIAHLMGKKTIAEFAESESIITILDEMKLDFAQGYATCPPRPLLKANKDLNTPQQQQDVS